jgi:hypothetical protein
MDRDVAQQAATPQAPGQAGLFSVPNPYPLTLAGLLAALGPQAINFGISVGGGETMLIPNIASLGGTRLFWLMTISTVLETVVVYECIKYSMVTGRSFFSMTRDIKPYGFWPWFWAISALATFAWPAWLAGASSAMFKLTGVATYYTWCAVALVAVLLVFYFSNVIYHSLSKIFIAVMWINIVAVIIVVVLIATKDDYLTVLWGYFNFGIAGYPEGVKLSLAAAILNQPGGSLMWVSFWVLEAGWGMGRYTGRVTGVLRILNVAHGGIYAFGAYMGTYLALGLLGLGYSPYWSYLMLLAGALLVGLTFGPVIERLFLRRIYGQAEAIQLLLTFSIFLILDDLMKLIWGTKPMFVSAPYILLGQFSVAGITYSWYHILLIGLSVAFGGSLM